MESYQLLYAVKAELQKRARFLKEAADNCRKAIFLTGNQAEIDFLQEQLDNIVK